MLCALFSVSVSVLSSCSSSTGSDLSLTAVDFSYCSSDVWLQNSIHCGKVQVRKLIGEAAWHTLSDIDGHSSVTQWRTKDSLGRIVRKISLRFGDLRRGLPDGVCPADAVLRQNVQK